MESLKGDTINFMAIGDTTSYEITDDDRLTDYVVINQGYKPDSITIEFFILRNSKSSEHLIIITEVLKLSDSLYCNLVLDVLSHKLKQNQKIEFNFCSYMGKPNPNIVVVMEATDTPKYYNKVIQSWEVIPSKRTVVLADSKRVTCAIDERKH